KTPYCSGQTKGFVTDSGSPVQAHNRPLPIKLASVKGVMGASAPPATAASTSPLLIIAAASAKASKPDGQADETVVALAQAPMRSAMVFAAACGIDAAAELTGARLGVPRSTAKCTLSITSIALVLTPITTGVGLGRLRLLISSPASLSAIMVAAYASCVCRAILLGFSSGSIYSAGSNPFISPAIRVLNFEASKSVIGPMPLRHWRSDSQNASKPIPLGARAPIPVMTTRFRLTMVPLRGASISSDYLRRSGNGLTIKNGRPSDVHQKRKF